MIGNTTACHDCDLLIELDHVNDADPDRMECCPRCGHKLAVGHHNALDAVIALSVTAVTALAISVSCPFLILETQGQSRTITLLDAIVAVFERGFPIMALLVFGFVIALPLIYLCSLLALTVPLRLGFRHIWPGLLARNAGFVLSWSMSEVFLIGVLIALIKIVSMATIIMGASFWAYVAFTLLFIKTVGVAGRYQLWAWVDEATAGSKATREARRA